MHFLKAFFVRTVVDKELQIKLVDIQMNVRYRIPNLEHILNPFVWTAVFLFVLIVNNVEVVVLFVLFNH